MHYLISAALLGCLHVACQAAQQPHALQTCQEISIDASKHVSNFKNLQATSNADTSLLPPGLDDIHDMEPEIADLWPEYGMKSIFIYTWPDVFTGFGRSGPAGDASLASNYNWTLTDRYVRFVTSRGAKASLQFQITNGTDPERSTPEKLGQVGFAIADRYMNGAGNSGFKDALELFDYYVEIDNNNEPSTLANYNTSFKFFTGFAKGVARASIRCGVGAWGTNRIVPTHANYSVYDPYVSQFYRDCKAYNVPIKAATYHFTNAQFSLNPYDIKTLTDRFRSEILAPTGFANLPIWVTQYDPNPSGVQPTSAQAIKDYNDPSFFASFTLGTSMYAQDTSLDRAMPWTGFGYGGTGAGNAPFQPWFNRSSATAIPLNVAAAWKLQGELVVSTPQRLQLSGSSSNGFAVLAGRSNTGSRVNILLNNYQPNYDIAREIARQMTPLMNTSTTAFPLIQSNGLFNGEQACFKPGNPLFYIPLCQSYVQAYIRENHATRYRLRVSNLPWSAQRSYKLVVQRVGDGTVHRVLLEKTGRGKSIDIILAFPANTQDLVSIEAL
ncbi:hypothetical protein D6C76_04300 [Aureobasidium pullulans]|nr:hypothetical protein D6C76_04300 [Aureobasidium pullulans]